MDNDLPEHPVPRWMQRLIEEFDDEDSYLPERYPLPPEQSLPF